jgi:hypothetical protein
VDPLKPFGSIIRSVWDKTARRVDRNEKTTSTTAAAENTLTHAVVSAPPLQPLHSRLRARIPSANSWDAAHARGVFVESVLLSELGDDLAKDPAFAQVVKKISQQLGGNPKLSARLDVLLKQLSQGIAIE